MDANSALQWAQSNPNDPRAKAVLAKAWAMQNPKDPRSAQIMQRIGASAQQAQNPQQIPDSADKAAQGSKPQAQAVSNQQGSPLSSYLAKGVGMLTAARMGLVKGATLGNFDPADSMKGLKAAETDNPTMTKLGTMAGGMATGAVGGELMPAAGALGRIAQNTGLGGALGGLSKPEEGGSRSINALKGAGLGLGTSAALEGAGAVTGKLGDYLMQKAVGMRKYSPGAGEKLADMGVVGTKNRMFNQVTSKLGDAENQLQDVVKNIPGTSDAQEIADAITNRGSRFQLPSSGKTGPGMEQYAEKIKEAARGFQSSGEGGELTAPDLLSIKRQGDWLGYTNSGNKATSLEAELGRAQADQAREMLASASNETTRKILGNEKALITAKNALEKPETIHQGMGSGLIFGKVPGQSLLSSLLGQTGVKSGQAAKAVADPAVLQGLFEALNQSQQK